MIVTGYGDEIRRKFGTIAKLLRSLKLVQNSAADFSAFAESSATCSVLRQRRWIFFTRWRQFVLATWLVMIRANLHGSGGEPFDVVLAVRRAYGVSRCGRKAHHRGISPLE